MELRFGCSRGKRRLLPAARSKGLPSFHFPSEMVGIQPVEAVLEQISKSPQIRLALGKGGRSLPREKCGDP
jgi:hypothetical protein